MQARRPTPTGGRPHSSQSHTHSNTHSNPHPPSPPGQRPASPTASRRLVEEYRRLVQDSGREPPAYHTFSDRYGGSKGLPFATRKDGVLKGMEASPHGAGDAVQWCLHRAELAEAAGQFQDAQKFLQAALEQIQRGGTETVGSVGNSEEKLEQDRVRTADVLCRLGKLSMRQGEYKEALRFLTLSSRVDPLNSTTYALRGACYEYLENYTEAYEEYKKYLSLNEPTMPVLAHTGLCALNSGQFEIAEKHLYELIKLTKIATTTSSPSNTLGLINYLNLFDSPSFYEAHAYYCLGLVKEKQSLQTTEIKSGILSENLISEELSEQAQYFYELAASNSSYVTAHEEAAESAISVHDASLALESLRRLQHLRRSYAKYYSRAADVCSMINNTELEVEELSKALDQRQTIFERRQTLLRRASVYASKLHNLNNAIVDLSLLLSMPGNDHCTAMAYLQRARAFQQRSIERPQTSKEDLAAALYDYDMFVETALIHSEGLPAPPGYITEAMLILANGAFKEKKYNRAALFFARAVARGWQPREPLPQLRRKTQKIGINSSLFSFSSSMSTPLLNVDLLGQMYVSMAHNVINKYPITEDMFRISYEQREKPQTVFVTETKKSKAAERKEAEKPAVSVPAVGYQIVEEEYQRLRALEPTLFSSLQYELLELWEPYRKEVEKLREDLMLTRSGKKVKRR